MSAVPRQAHCAPLVRAAEPPLSVATSQLESGSLPRAAAVRPVGPPLAHHPLAAAPELHRACVTARVSGRQWGSSSSAGTERTGPLPQSTAGVAVRMPPFCPRRAAVPLLGDSPAFSLGGGWWWCIVPAMGQGQTHLWHTQVSLDCTEKHYFEERHSFDGNGVFGWLFFPHIGGNV